MKKFSILVSVALIWGSLQTATCQYEGGKTSIIAPIPLSITYSKTSSIVFPFPVISIDKGSADVLVQKAKGVDNVVQLKAAKKGFEQTNLTVITSDGKLYSYLLDYADSPRVLTLRNLSSSGPEPFVVLGEHRNNEEQMYSFASIAAQEPRTVYGIQQKKYHMKFCLNGIFIHEGVMYYQLNLINHTNIKYDIDQLRFFIRDEKKSKRTAIQEQELQPLYIYHYTPSVGGQSQHTLVYALDKYTIPDKKQLVIELLERSGGRHMQLSLSNTALLRSKVIGTPLVAISQH